MLTLICGPPNAGKTTLSRGFTDVVHVDEVRRPHDVLARVAASDSICVEGVFARASERERLLRAYGRPDARCIWLDVDERTSVAREARGRPAWALRACARDFEPPTLAEGWLEVMTKTVTKEGNSQK